MRYRNEVLADRPDHYYPLGDRSSDLCRDAIPTGTNGTYPSAPTFGDRTLVDGSRAPRFSGSHYAHVGTWGLAPQWTMEYWTITASFNDGWVIGKDDQVERGWAFRCLKDRRAYLWGGAEEWVPNGTEHTAGRLHHDVWTYDGSTYRYYLDGQHKASLTRSSFVPVGGSRPVNIGRRAYSGFETPFDGWIGHVAQYPRALSHARVRARYAAGLRLDVPGRRLAA